MLVLPRDRHREYLENNIIKPWQFNDVFEFQNFTPKTFAIDVSGLALPLTFTIQGQFKNTTVWFSGSSKNKRPNEKRHEFKFVNKHEFTWPPDHKETNVLKKMALNTAVYITIETTQHSRVNCHIAQNPKNTEGID